MCVFKRLRYYITTGYKIQNRNKIHISVVIQNPHPTNLKISAYLTLQILKQASRPVGGDQVDDINDLNITLHLISFS